MPGAEIIEVPVEQVELLPGGKEADGIIGDFVMRSDVVEAVISHNAPLRRANMSTFYGEDGITPGCLYDLTLRGASNDQITIFSPLGQQGPVSWVRAVDVDGADGEVAMETVVTGAVGGGLERTHRYILRDGLQGVVIVSTVRNVSGETRPVKMADRWTNFSSRDWGAGFVWADAVDPADKAGYAYGWIEWEGIGTPPAEEIALAPGEEIVAARFLAVGRSPAEAVGHVAAVRGPVGALVGLMHDPSGQPITTGRAVIPIADEKSVAAYPDEAGKFRIHLPPGDYAIRFEDAGRSPVERVVTVAAGAETEAIAGLGGQSAIQFAVRDAAGRPIPCKAQITGIDGTPTPDLGPPNRARGCVDQYHSENGSFRVPVAPGQYRVVVTRGIEFSHLAREVTVTDGMESRVEGALERLVQTPGWVSTDFHNHSTPSGDNTCGTDDRIINLAAEHIEFAPTTEHNRLYDWRPHIEKLGLAGELQTVSGLELTGSGAHLNMFPAEPRPRTQDNGAPVWQKDPRLNAIVLRHFQNDDPDRWVHLNHPDMVEDFVDRDGDGVVDGGFAYLGNLLNALESENYLTDFERGGGILADAPFRLRDPLEKGDRIVFHREFLWLQMLNQGVRVWGIAVADAHSVHGNGVGGWRTYVPSSTDAPADIDWREISRNAKAGRLVLTTGPFLEATVNGALPGSEIPAAGAEVEIAVRVQCTDWIDIDRVQVLVNGRQRGDLNFTRTSHPDWFGDGVVKFDRTIKAPIDGDAHVIVVAIGEQHDLRTGFGTSPQGAMLPCAYTNPVFVDSDGDGFQPSGDTLGYPLPVQGLTPDHVRALLGAAQ